MTCELSLLWYISKAQLKTTSCLYCRQYKPLVLMFFKQINTTTTLLSTLNNNQYCIFNFVNCAKCVIQRKSVFTFWITLTLIFLYRGSAVNNPQHFSHLNLYNIKFFATSSWSVANFLQDDPCFLLHFDKVRTVTAVSCSAKYTIVRALVAVSDQYCQRSLNLRNFDWSYIKPTSFYSNRGDCVVLTQICFYAFNLVCLSMCPVPLDA